jgi:hypothetical protein
VIGARLLRRIQRDFPDAEAARGVVGALRKLALEEKYSERILAAAVFSAGADVNRFRSAIRLAGLDWRDLLMGSGLEHANWRDVLDEELGPR